MDKSEIIQEAKKYIGELFRDNADGHDVSHTLRVLANAKKIAEKYPESDSFIIELAALLHDTDDHKLFKTENNANARKFLENSKVDKETQEQVIEAINSVSFSKNRGKTPSTLEGRIVQDADRLDALGAIGIARTFAYGGRAGRPLEASRQHFDDKLLLLKDEMNTEEGRRLAKERHELMESFLAEYDKETRSE